MAKVTARLVDNFSTLAPQAKENIREGVRKAVLQGAQRLEGHTKDWIKDNGPYDRGRLRQSIHSDFVRVPGLIAASVSSNVDYAEAAHEGRKPGKMPPVSALEGWVRRRVRQGRMELGGLVKGQRGVTAKRERAIKTAAFLIARAIGRRGTKGVRFFDETFDLYGDRVRREIEGQMVRLIREELTRG